VALDHYRDAFSVIHLIFAHSRTLAAAAAVSPETSLSLPLSARNFVAAVLRFLNSITRRHSSNKGKEKDDEQPPPPPRVRVFDDDDVADNDVDSDGGGGGGMFNQNLTTASSALQGLLRKIGWVIAA
ncbi:hypothetical protein Tco_1127835, partial [Tanacetum coccineum]